MLAVIALAFAPLFLSQSASADPRADYDALVAQAQAKISAAQEALTAAQTAYDNAVADKHTIDLMVSDNLEILNSAMQNKQVKQQAVLNAQEALDAAQTQYDTALIPDPLWIHPTYQQEHTRQISYTEMVPRVITTERAITKTTGGLTAKVYNMAGYNNAPPLPTENRLVSTQTVPNINYDWGGGQILNTYLYEDTIVKFTGYITLPSNGTYTFYAPGDDGVQLFIDGSQVINDWHDKGGGGTMVQRQMTAGQHEITLWYYENGGGANVWLYWIKPDGTFEIVPASAFGNQITTEIIYEQTTVYDEVTKYKDEIYYTTELVPGATAPLINDPALKAIVDDKQSSLTTAQNELVSATETEVSAQASYEESLTAQSEKAGIIVVASNDVINKQENVYIAQQELEAIPPFREPTPTPEATQEPTKEPEIPVTPEIPEPVTPTPTETNTTVLEATAQLEERSAENDTGVLPYTVADVVTELQAEQTVAILSDPAALAGAIGQGLADTAEFIGQALTEPGKALAAVTEAVSKAGLDMSDDQREKAQEVIIPVVIVSQIASVIVGRIK